MGYFRLLLALMVAASHLQTSTFYGVDEGSIYFVGPIVAVNFFLLYQVSIWQW